MLILNATKNVKSVMTDRGDLVTIKPGELSPVMVASRNLILSAINLGSPAEVGVILNSSYEMEIIKNITGAAPYIYTDTAEAQARLIDPSIDYQGTLAADKVNLLNVEAIKEKDEEIKSLKEQVKELTEKLAQSTDNSEVADLTAKLTQANQLHKEVQLERDRLKTQLLESQDQVKDLTDKVNQLRNESGSASQELTSSNEMITKLSLEKDELIKKVEVLEQKLSAVPEDNSEELKSTVETLTNDVEQLTKSNEELTSTNQSLKSSLKEASEQIDFMKSEFNKACEKFKITKDDNGEWVQITE